MTDATTGSTLTAPFWTAAARHELVRPVCANCGRSFFTPQVACPHCLSEEWSWEPSSGRGTVHSYTVVHRAPLAEFATPYVVADVDVEEGWHLMTNIVGVAPEHVRVDQPVVVSWTAAPDGTVLPTFTPKAGEGP